MPTTDDSINENLSHLINVALCSGIGQHHTNEPNARKPDKRLTPYQSNTIVNIRALVDNPQQVDKSAAQWLIPSTLPSRVFKTQRDQGQFALIWADLDDNPPTLTIVGSVIQSLFPECQYEIYTSRSAREDYQKARILIPLSSLITGADFVRCQKLFNAKLLEAGITPDTVNEGAAQLCYLPNRGNYYNSLSNRTGTPFSPLAAWSSELAAMAHEEARKTAERERVQAERKAEKERVLAEQVSKGEQTFTSNDLIGTFNGIYEPGPILTAAGYQWDGGDAYMHPLSESGSYSCGLLLHDDGLLKANALSTSDLLFNAGAGAHTAFSCFCELWHAGDLKKALTDAGDHHITIGVESWNAVQRREYRKQQAAEATANSGAAFIAAALASVNSSAQQPSALSLLQGLSATTRLSKMKNELLNDAFVFDGLALAGQITLFYAQANTGKTLIFMHLLEQAIEKKAVDAKDIFYINADDSHKGLYEKACIAEEMGFLMIGPDEANVTRADILALMEGVCASGEAKGKVFILDTLKQFADMMSKQEQKKFFVAMRNLAMKGATIILAGHTNKKYDIHAKEYLYEGTGDTMNDLDCAYYLEAVSSHEGEKVVEFRKKKDRGDMTELATFKYSKKPGMTYRKILSSVCRVTRDEVKEILHGDVVRELQDSHAIEIALIQKVIFEHGPINQSNILLKLSESPNLKVNSTMTRLRHVIQQSILDGQEWDTTRQTDNNAKMYRTRGIEQTVSFI